MAKNDGYGIGPAPIERAKPFSSLASLDSLPRADVLIDQDGTMAIVTTEPGVRCFYETAEVLWTAETWGEFAARMLETDIDSFESVFGCRSLEEIPENRDPWEPDEPFSAEDLVTYNEVPPSPVVAWAYNEPECIQDLYQPWDDGTVDDFLPASAYDTALSRLRANGYDVAEAPGLLDAMTGLVVGGQLR